jgi:tripartite-type tricarboxylate transporter receptor subunit TctC
MKFPIRRQFLRLTAGTAALPALSRAARAQPYPSRPVRVVVGFPAGGTNDIHARLIAEWLSKQFGRSFVVENRPGAAGNIALESVVRAASDGYTLSVCGSTELRNEILYNDLKFSFMHDTTPVASLTLAMNVLVVHPEFSVRSVPELIAAAKANPNAITVASSGLGSTPHVFWELFRSMTGARMLHVPYRGGAQALTDVLGRQVQIYFATIADAMEHIRAGRLRALAAPARHAHRPCRRFRPLANSCPVMKQSAGWASSPQTTRPPRSSKHSTRRSTPALPMPKSANHY